MINICVVGHTNTGKTSLLRTLSRSERFGDVDNSFATTRHVSELILYDNHDHQIVLYDTPGFEDADGVLEAISHLSAQRDDGIKKLTQFIEAFEAGQFQEFSQEIKVIKQVMTAHVALYVIDLRLPPTQKYQDELLLLSLSGIPVLAVLNFVAHTQYQSAWIDMLARRNVHLHCLFDTVAFDFDNEIRLWQLISTVRPYDNPLSDFIAHRQHTWQNLQDTANRFIAEFLIDVASFALKIHASVQTDIIDEHEALQDMIRQAKQKTDKRLGKLYKFYHHTLDESPLVLTWQTQDPFDKQLIANYGVRTARASGLGAMIGAGIDLVTFGASLGAGTVIGGLLGGGFANARTISDKLNGTIHLRVDDDTLLVLANQLIGLHHALRHTGHATQTAIHPSQNHAILWQTLPAALKKVRHHTHLSGLNGQTPNARLLKQKQAHIHALIQERFIPT